MIECLACGTFNRSVAQFCKTCGTRVSFRQGRYEVLRKLGQGGMGAMYQVLDLRLPGTLWAIKEMFSGALTVPEETAVEVAAFRQEAELLGRLNHPNIPRFSDSFTEGRKHYIVTEFVQGETLQARLARKAGPCGEADVRNWALQLCDVLIYLHGQNPPIIHRGITPNNIMLTPEGQIKLVDFSIARLFKPGKTRDTQLMGTPGYAPPEQHGIGQTDARSDIYALGATLYFLVTAQVPPESTKLAAGAPLTPPRQIRPSLSLDMQSVIFKAMAPNAAQRYQSAAEMQAALWAGAAPPPPALVLPQSCLQPAPAAPLPRPQSIRESISGWLHRRTTSKESSPVMPPAVPSAPSPRPSSSVQSNEPTGALLAPSPTSPSSTQSNEPMKPHSINRFPDVTFPERVVIHERSILRVAITQQPVRVEVTPYVMSIRVPASAKEVAVDILVTAEGFEIIGAVCHALVVPLDGDSESVLFTLVPRALGEKKIKIEFFQEGRYIGGATAATTVVQPTLAFNAKPASALGIVGLQTTVLPPDLTILITESRPSSDHMQYSFRLHSPANGLFYYPLREPLIFSGSPSRWIEGLCRELGTLRTQASPSDVAETLATIGASLYENLFPRELKEIWSRCLRGRVRSIQIISDEPWIPWEIIRPSCVSETGVMMEDGFLCEDYVLTRWIAGPPPPSAIRISHGAVIAPVTANLPNVQREVTFVKGMPGNVEEIEPSLAFMRGLLKTGGFQLLHFACHGSFDPVDYEQSSIHLLGSDRLRPRDITGERRNFGKDSPLVFVNACHTARGDFSLVGIGSWAEKFVNANSSGFLGASWAVDDTLAYRFCIVFYGALLEGKLIGEAMREARIVIKDAGDPTWLAYTLYADPLARVVFG
jgi:serine/threonine protein kinase